MNTKTAWIGLLQGLAVALALGACVPQLTAEEVALTRTNWTERWITNVIEVSMPQNRFVNEYHTNWVPQFRTNIVDVYATNWMMQKVTNVVEVSATWTNRVTAYRTNWTTRVLTNHLAVNLVRTNFTERYRTNWSTLELTNWVTVIQFKTNWVAQAVTNLVQIDLPGPTPSAAVRSAAMPEPKEAVVDAAPATPGGSWSGPLMIEASRTGTAASDGMVEVRLKVRWSTSSTAPLQVQRWRVESEDGAMLFSGQERDFKRQLPVGKYKVEARLQPQGANPALVARGILSVTLREAVVQPRLIVRK